MAFGLLLPLRIAQFVFAVVVVGLSSYGMDKIIYQSHLSLTNESIVAHWYNADTLTASPSQINFLIFVPLFSFISVVYLEVVPRFMPKGKTSHNKLWIQTNTLQPLTHSHTSPSRS